MSRANALLDSSCWGIPEERGQPCDNNDMSLGHAGLHGFGQAALPLVMISHQTAISTTRPRVWSTSNPGVTRSQSPHISHTLTILAGPSGLSYILLIHMATFGLCVSNLLSALKWCNPPDAYFCLFGYLHRAALWRDSKFVTMSIQRRASGYTATRSDQNASHALLVRQTRAILHLRFYADALSSSRG
jgi:hypothetical protein